MINIADWDVKLFLRTDKQANGRTDQLFYVFYVQQVTMYSLILIYIIDRCSGLPFQGGNLASMTADVQVFYRLELSIRQLVSIGQIFEMLWNGVIQRWWPDPHVTRGEAWQQVKKFINLPLSIDFIDFLLGLTFYGSIRVVDK